MRGQAESGSGPPPPRAGYGVATVRRTVGGDEGGPWGGRELRFRNSESRDPGWSKAGAAFREGRGEWKMVMMATKEGAIMTMTETLILAVLSATDTRKEVALKVLRGEVDVSDQGPTQKMAESFVNLRECGRRVGVSACSLWRWGVPGHDLGGRRRFRMTEVEAYLQSEEFRTRADELIEERARSRKERGSSH
jgi:hypothetical protein